MTPSWFLTSTPSLDSRCLRGSWRLPVNWGKPNPPLLTRLIAPAITRCQQAHRNPTPSRTFTILARHLQASGPSLHLSPSDLHLHHTLASPDRDDVEEAYYCYPSVPRTTISTTPRPTGHPAPQVSFNPSFLSLITFRSISFARLHRRRTT